MTDKDRKVTANVQASNAEVSTNVFPLPELSEPASSTTPPNIGLSVAPGTDFESAIADAPTSTSTPASPQPGRGHSQKPATTLRVPHFVTPSSYLRLKPSRAIPMATITSTKPDSPSPSPLDREQQQGLVCHPILC